METHDMSAWQAGFFWGLAVGIWTQLIVNFIMTIRIFGDKYDKNLSDLVRERLGLAKQPKDTY